MMMKQLALGTGLFAACVVAAGCATKSQEARAENEPAPLPSNSKPRPEYFNLSYGPHERNVLDLWQAKSGKPTPLLIFFHGGGFIRGDKWSLDPDLLERCLKEGISVASANYRYSTQQPFPGPMRDGARAVQFVRYQAKALNIDPKRIALSGNSAGAGISLWLAFHDDLADRRAGDPVLRQSTRITCAGVWGGQCSYDPRFVRHVIGGRAYEHPALLPFYGITAEDLDTPKAYAMYEQASAINYISRDDPPVILFYSEPKEPLKPGPNRGATLYYPHLSKDLPGEDAPGWGIHHPKFGFVLDDALEPLGVECVVRHTDDYGHVDKPNAKTNEEFVAFLKRHFKMS